MIVKHSVRKDTKASDLDIKIPEGMIPKHAPLGMVRFTKSFIVATMQLRARLLAAH